MKTAGQLAFYSMCEEFMRIDKETPMNEEEVARCLETVLFAVEGFVMVYPELIVKDMSPMDVIEALSKRYLIPEGFESFVKDKLASIGVYPKLKIVE